MELSTDTTHQRFLKPSYKKTQACLSRNLSRCSLLTDKSTHRILDVQPKVRIDKGSQVTKFGICKVPIIPQGFPPDSWVIIWHICHALMHYKGNPSELPYHIFALFDPLKMGNWMTPAREDLVFFCGGGIVLNMFFVSDVFQDFFLVKVWS